MGHTVAVDVGGIHIRIALGELIGALTWMKIV
jgi:hypothetical protein